MNLEPEKNSTKSDLKQIRVQLVWIKYIMAGILGLALFGRTGSISLDLTILGVTLMCVNSVETGWTMFGTSTVKLGDYFKRRKAAAALSEARMKELMAEVEALERQLSAKAAKSPEPFEGAQ